MDGQALLGNQQPPALKPDLNLFFAVPACSQAGMTDEDWLAECDRMFNHSRLVQRFVQGQISPQDFEDSIADLGLDPYLIEDGWSEGHSLLY